MQNMLRSWVQALAYVLLLALTGCAATGPSYAVVSSALPEVPEHAGRVVFYRPEAMIGAAVQPEIRLDNVVVGRSQPGGFFYVDTQPGRHMVSASTEVEARAEFDVEGGQTVFISTSIGIGLFVGRLSFSFPSRYVAQSELPSTRYTGSAAPPVVAGGTTAPKTTGPPNTETPSRRGVTMSDLEALLPVRSGN